MAAAGGVSRRTCRVCHFDRPTAALSPDRSSVAVQKIRGNITGYRGGFGSAREEELIPALAVISRSSATPRRVSAAMSLSRKDKFRVAS